MSAHATSLQKRHSRSTQPTRRYLRMQGGDSPSPKQELHNFPLYTAIQPDCAPLSRGGTTQSNSADHISAAENKGRFRLHNDVQEWAELSD